MNKTLREVLALELDHKNDPLPQPEPLPRLKTNAEILKNIIDFYKRGGDEK